ncbi:MAG: hypothetical protein IJB24_03055 [Clostridia bacterium]|nr:hypothetical protein [Clostridia bacterium]
MIIKATQTASNIKQEYDIYVDDRYFKGRSGGISRFQNIHLNGRDTVISGSYMIPRFDTNIPVNSLLGSSAVTRRFRIIRNGKEYAEVMYTTQGIAKNCYIIKTAIGETLVCYNCFKGSFDYISLYCGHQQIALIETYLNVSDYMYTHKAYLLDEYKEYGDLTAFFILYYSSYRFARRFHMSAGSSQYSYGRSFSVYNDMYDPKWRETNFPDENFFGKLNRFD